MHQTELHALPDTFLFTVPGNSPEKKLGVVKTLTGIITAADAPTVAERTYVLTRESPEGG
jgi:hypothetical protein